MKVTFEATVDDFIDVTLRSVPRGGVYYFNLLFTALVVGVAYAAIGYWFFSQRWIAAVIGFVIGVVMMVVYNYNARTRKLREYYQERKLVNGPVKIEVEIGEDGLTFRQDGDTVTTAWSNIEKIDETDDAIYFQRRGNIFSAVRKRGFASDLEKEEFLILAKRLMQEHAPSESSA